VNPISEPSRQSEEGAPGKPGRKLGPIADGASSAHRAWLEPLRERFLSSGLTISDLQARSGWAKSKISELLRGTGLYPRWEITHSLLRELAVPAWPVRRLWSAAALEAQKKPDWIKGCIDKQALSTSPETPPLDHSAFSELQYPAYRAYASVFLSDHEAEQAISEAFDILWLRWDEALASSDVVKFAWPVLRRSVMTRARHIDGCPELVTAAFDTVALSILTTDEERFAQIEETLALFKSMSRLPDNQLDVMILSHLRGMEPAAVADVLGVSIATVRSNNRHARHALETAFFPQHDPEGNTQ
jgi:RNA polymerase sigma factor (sigma-70 family)